MITEESLVINILCTSLVVDHCTERSFMILFTLQFVPGIPAGPEEVRGRGIPGTGRAGPAGTEAEPRAGSVPGVAGPEVRGAARSTAGAAGRTEG